MNTRMPIIAATAVVLVALLAGCAPDQSATPPASAPPITEPSGGSASTAPSGSASFAPPTCDTLIDSGLRASLLADGWVPIVDEFRIDGDAIDGGLLCRWGAPEASTAQVQLYGWAPIDVQAAATAQQTLVSNGWRREDGPRGVYVTENPDTVFSPDDEGYGMTYLFGDGWVIVSDQKQGLLLIEVPGA